MSVEENLPNVTNIVDNTKLDEIEPHSNSSPTSADLVITVEQNSFPTLEITELEETTIIGELDIQMLAQNSRRSYKNVVSLGIGDSCEVAGLKAEGLGSSWCPATLITEDIKKGSDYLVEYKTLLDENDNSKKLREKVKSRRIRPEQVPCEVDITLKPGFPVDIFLNDIWWNVVVKTSLDGRLEVSFPSYALEPCYSLPNNVLSPLKFEPKDGDIRPGLEYKTDLGDGVKKWFWRESKVVYDSLDAEPLLAVKKSSAPRRRSTRREPVKPAIPQSKRATKRKRSRRG